MTKRRLRLRKVEALKNSTAPKNVKQVRQFLGLAGYFRRFIYGYATKTACIALLTKNRSSQRREQCRI